MDEGQTKSPRRILRELFGEPDDHAFTFEGRRIMVGHRPAYASEAASYSGRVRSDKVTDNASLTLYVDIPFINDRPLRCLRYTQPNPERKWRAVVGRDDSSWDDIDGDILVHFLT